MNNKLKERKPENIFLFKVEVFFDTLLSKSNITSFASCGQTLYFVGSYDVKLWFVR